MHEEQERGQRWEAYAKKAGFLDDYGICQPGQHERTATSWYTWEACEKALASLAKPQPVGGALTDAAPHFPGCETPEPTLGALIYRYYRAHFDDKEVADGYARQYIATLSAPVAREPVSEITDEQIVAALKACDKEDVTQEGWIWRQRIKWGRAVLALAAPAQAAAVPEALDLTIEQIEHEAAVHGHYDGVMGQWVFDEYGQLEAFARSLIDWSRSLAAALSQGDVSGEGEGA
jgi:hypothetical protein